MPELAAKLLPAPGPGRYLAASSLVSSVGYGLYASGSLLYFTRVVGLSVTQVGVGLSIAGVLAFLISVPVGRVADRLGAREVTVAVCVLQAVLLVSAIFVDRFALFLPLICLLGAAEQAGSVTRGALVAAVTGKDDRVRTMAYLRSVFNIGITAGTLLAGVAFAFDTRLAYSSLMLGNALTALLSCLTYLRLPSVARRSGAGGGRSRFIALADVPYTLIALFCGFGTISDTILVIGIPLWTVNYTSAPRPLAAWLIAMNTAIVIGLQVWASRGADTSRRAGRLLGRAMWAVALACVLLALSSHHTAVLSSVILVAGVAVLSVGELWLSSGSWGLRYGLAPDDSQGEYGGVFSLGGSLRAMVGPALVTMLMQRLESWAWVVLAVAFVVAGVAARPLVGWAVDTRDRWQIGADDVRAQ